MKDHRAKRSLTTASYHCSCKFTCVIAYVSFSALTTFAYALCYMLIYTIAIFIFKFVCYQLLTCVSSTSVSVESVHVNEKSGNVADMHKRVDLNYRQRPQKG